MSSASIIQSQTFDHSFAWQVGFTNFESSTQPLQFRATVRPLTYFETNNRLPSSTVLYEESGIVLNSADSMGAWDFPLSVNASIAGGPYRDYQVVIEAHDTSGNTSAGNTVGTSDENGWTAYPFGYDIVAIHNPRPTGIELQNNIPTLDSGDGSYIIGNTDYKNTAYVDPNGGVVIYFTSGNLDSDLAGGYLYVSTGTFPKAEVLTGCLVQDSYWYNQVSKTRFDFDPLNPIVYHQNAARILNQNQVGYANNTISGYVSISFYDKLDKEVIDQYGTDISSGLYLSNNAGIYKDAAIGRLILGGSAIIRTVVWPASAPCPVNINQKYQLFSGDPAFPDSNGNIALIYIDPAPDSGSYWPI